MSFTFEFQLDPREHVRVCRTVHLRRYATAYMIIAVGLVAVVGLHVLVVALGGKGWPPGTALVSLIALVACAAMYFGPRHAVREMRLNNRAAAGPHVYELTDTGLRLSSPGVASSVEWANVVEMHETTEFLFFYVSNNQAVVLPKAAVGLQALPSVRTALKAWVGARARLQE